MLLIDGHNLIGKLPDISLSDPDDEAKLVRVLENYHALHPHEAILVVFDPSRDSNRGWTNMRSSIAGVAVRFAPRGTTADAVIEKLLREDKNARRITVVSSDNAVRKAAREHGAKSLSSEAFIVKLREHANPRKRKSSAVPGHESREKPDDADVQYWSQFFKEPKRKHPPFSPARSQSQSPGNTPSAPLKNGPDKKSQAVEDIAYWLKIFGEPQVPTADAEAKPTSRQSQKQTESDIEYWLREFSRKR